MLTMDYQWLQETRESGQFSRKVAAALFSAENTEA